MQNTLVRHFFKRSFHCATYIFSLQVFDQFDQVLGVVRGRVTTPQTFEADGGLIKVQFESDQSTSLEGYRASYQQGKHMFGLAKAKFSFESNLSLYSLYYAEACNKFAGPISASLPRGNTVSFEEMSQRQRAVDITVRYLTGPIYEP